VLGRAAALLLAGDTARAESELVLAIELATAAGAAELTTLGLCLRSLVAVEENQRADAEAFAEEAASISTVEPTPSLVALLLEAVGARNAARRGDIPEATAALERADELLLFATPAVPWLAAYALLELARVRLALADADGARALLRRVADIFRVRPRLGVLVQRNAELDGRTHALAEPQGRWASSLTPAEQRLLPLLATHLSFREIGERLYVSRNTVKTQAIAVYRKFGVTSRSAAIERAVSLGLIDEAATVPQEGFGARTERRRSDPQETTSLQFGRPVRCSDGPVGSLSDLVIDPAERRVSHLVVEAPNGAARLVPADLLVTGQGPGGDVVLSCSVADVLDRGTFARSPTSAPGRSLRTTTGATSASRTCRSCRASGEPTSASSVPICGATTRSHTTAFRPAPRSSAATASPCPPEETRSARSTASWSPVSG
jgi:Response regulator containing a CheY-like receiver domain and an HTH DNA-binding domain